MAITPPYPRIERPVAGALAILLCALALYGCWSTPGLVERWGMSPMGLVLLAVWATAAAWAMMAGTAAARGYGRAGWAAFVVVAIGLRLFSLTLVAGRISPGDSHWYLELAQYVLAGQGLFIDDPAMGTRAWAEFPPAYPLLLAGWGAVAGLSGLSVLVLSTLLDLGAAAMIARLGARLGAARAGRVAAALYLIWPSVLLDAPLAQKESLELVAVLALAHGWLGAQGDTARTGWERDCRSSLVTVLAIGLAIGLPAGLLALTQPGMAPLAALFGLALAPRLGWRRFASVAGSAAVVAAVVMVPWWVRNWQVFHAFVPLTSVGGLSLWIGENPNATGNWESYPAALVGLPELACSRAAGRLAWAWMTHHPIGVARLNASKFVRAMGVGQFAIIRLDAMRPAMAPGVTAALLPLTQGAQLLLLGAGGASLLNRRPPLLTALIVAIVAQLVVFGVWFEFGERHRELLTPFLLLSIGMAVANLRPRTTPSALPRVRQAA